MSTMIPERNKGDLVRVMDTMTAREMGLENVRGKVIDSPFIGHYTILTEDGEEITISGSQLSS